jgi:hypothetical protein
MKPVFVPATVLILLVASNAFSPAPAQNSIGHPGQTIAQSAAIRIAKIDPVSTLRVDPEQAPHQKSARLHEPRAAAVPLSLLYLIAATAGKTR